MPSCIPLSNALHLIPRCSCHRAHTSLLMPQSSLLIVDVSFLILPVYAVWLIPCASCLHIHTSLLIRHLAVLPSSFMPFCSYLIAHTSLPVPHCSYIIAPSSLSTFHFSLCLAHAFLLIPSRSCLASLTSLLMPFCSYLIAHALLTASVSKASCGVGGVCVQTGGGATCAQELRTRCEGEPFGGALWLSTISLPCPYHFLTNCYMCTRIEYKM